MENINEFMEQEIHDINCTTLYNRVRALIIKITMTRATTDNRLGTDLSEQVRQAWIESERLKQSDTEHMSELGAEFEKFVYRSIAKSDKDRDLTYGSLLALWSN